MKKILKIMLAIIVCAAASLTGVLRVASDAWYKISVRSPGQRTVAFWLLALKGEPR